MGDDTAVLGRAKLEEKKRLEVRAEREQVSAEKSKLRRCIMKLSAHSSTSVAIDLCPAKEYSMSWQRHLHTNPNNLNLK